MIRLNGKKVIDLTAGVLIDSFFYEEVNRDMHITPNYLHQ